MKRVVIVFLSFMALCALVVWLGGFNFDQRNYQVGFGFVISCLVSAFGVCMVEMHMVTFK